VCPYMLIRLGRQVLSHAHWVTAVVICIEHWLECFNIFDVWWWKQFLLFVCYLWQNYESCVTDIVNELPVIINWKETKRKTSMKILLLLIINFPRWPPEVSWYTRAITTSVICVHQCCDIPVHRETPAWRMKVNLVRYMVMSPICPKISWLP